MPEQDARVNLRTEVSPLPWVVAVDEECAFVKNGAYYVASCHEAPGALDDDGNEVYSPVANAAFICRAVNSHEALVAACRSALAWYGLDGDHISDPVRAQLLAAVALAEAPK